MDDTFTKDDAAALKDYIKEGHLDHDCELDPLICLSGNAEVAGLIMEVLYEIVGGTVDVCDDDECEDCSAVCTIAAEVSQDLLVRLLKEKIVVFTEDAHERLISYLEDDLS